MPDVVHLQLKSLASRGLKSAARWVRSRIVAADTQTRSPVLVGRLSVSRIGRAVLFWAHRDADNSGNDAR